MDLPPSLLFEELQISEREDGVEVDGAETLVVSPASTPSTEENLLDTESGDEPEHWSEATTVLIDGSGLEESDFDEDSSPSNSASTIFPIGNLPLEVQGTILRLLTDTEQITSRAVCKTWAVLIGAPCGRVTDNPRVLALFKNALFTRINDMVIEDFSQTELPRKKDGEIVPATVKKLEFRGILNLPESVKMLLTYYNPTLESLLLNQYCLGKIDNSVVLTWRFSSLHELSFKMAIPFDDEFPIKGKGICFCTHMNNWFTVFGMEFPLLDRVNGNFYISKINEKLKYKPVFDSTFVNMMPTFFAKFEKFVNAHKNQIKKFNFREEVHIRQFIQRNNHSILCLFDWKRLEIAFEDPTEFTRIHKTVGSNLVGLSGISMTDRSFGAFTRLIMLLDIMEDADPLFDCIYIDISYKKFTSGAEGEAAASPVAAGFPVDVKILVRHNEVV